MVGGDDGARSEQRSQDRRASEQAGTVSEVNENPVLALIADGEIGIAVLVEIARCQGNGDRRAAGRDRGEEGEAAEPVPLPDLDVLVDPVDHGEIGVGVGIEVIGDEMERLLTDQNQHRGSEQAGAEPGQDRQRIGEAVVPEVWLKWLYSLMS